MATHPDGKPARGLSQAELVDGVRRALRAIGGPAAEAAIEVQEAFRGDVAVRVPREHLGALLPRLRDDGALRFDMLLDVTCVHFPRRPAPLGPFDVVYHLLSVAAGHRLRLKVACPDPEAGVPSATATWPGANLMEREAYDMFGVRFQGHPDLRRILMGEDFDGWPLRKDFPYRGH